MYISCYVFVYSIIAVDYEARKYGVSRGNNGDEARKLCPHIKLPRIPEKRGKADLTNYRAASAEVIKVLSRFSSCIERASIDEAYIDITDAVSERIRLLDTTKVLPSMLPATHVAGGSLEGLEGNMEADATMPLGNSLVSRVLDQSNSEEEDDCDSLMFPETTAISRGDFDDGLQDLHTLAGEDTTSDHGSATREELLSTWLDREGCTAELLLSVGAIIANEIRSAVLNETGFTCSAGIAHNKVLAKLAAGMNKPNQQTILSTSLVPAVFDKTPFRKVRHLGGKLGEQVQQLLNICNVGQLRGFSKEALQRQFGEKTGSWLYMICRGVDNEPIRSRLLSQSIGCGKNFNGPEKLSSVQQVLYWLEQLTEEIFERLKVDQDEASCDPASVARSLWTAMMRGHSQPTSVDPAGRTPLTWTTGIVGLSVVATKFRPLARASSACTLDLFLAGPREPPIEARPLVPTSGETVEGPAMEGGAEREDTAMLSDDELLPSSKRLCPEAKVEPTSLGTVSCPQTDIRKYFSDGGGGGGGSGGDSAAICNPDVCQACTVCRRLVPIWQLQEHADYHLALQLRQEGSLPLSPSSQGNQKPALPGSNRKPPRTQKGKKHSPGQKRGREEGSANSLHKFLIVK
eukprot:Em0016g1018a